MTSQQTIEQFRSFVIGNYTRYPVCLVRGEGSEVWDAEGNRYLDFFPGWGCDLVAHRRDDPLRRMAEQATAPAGEEVEVAVPLGVPDPGAFAAHQADGETLVVADNKLIEELDGFLCRHCWELATDEHR